MVVDKTGNIFGTVCPASVRAENFEKMPKPFLLGFEPKFVIRQKGAEIGVKIVIERDRVEPQVCPAPGSAFFGSALGFSAKRVIERGGTKRTRRKRTVNRTGSGKPNIGGIIGTDRRGNRRVEKKPFPQRENLARRGTHQHNVDKPLSDNLAALLPKLIERFKLGFRAVLFWAFSGSRKPVCHIRIFGVGQNEIVTTPILENPR